MNIGSRFILNSPNYISAKSYIQDGLIGHWDGIENNGYGEHGNWLSYWKDLTGSGADWILGTLYKFNDDNIEYLGNPSSSGAGGLVKVTWTQTNIKQVETVFDSTNVDFSVSQYGRVSICYVGTSGGNTTYVIGFNDYGILCGGNKRITKAVADRKGIFSLSFDFSTTSKSLLNGVFTNPDATSNQHLYAYRTPLLGNYGSGYYAVGAKLKTVRLYNRVLSQEEQKYNYNIDYKRFNLNFTP